MGMSSAPDPAGARAGPGGHPAGDDLGSPCGISRVAVQKTSPGRRSGRRPAGRHKPLAPRAKFGGREMGLYRLSPTRVSRSDLREGADLTASASWSASRPRVDGFESAMVRPEWVVLIAGSSGSALRAVSPPQPSHHAERPGAIAFRLLEQPAHCAAHL